MPGTLSFRPGELPSVSVASGLCWRPQWSAASPDHLLGAIIGHSHGNLDEEMLELKGWEDSYQGAQRLPFPQGRLPPTHQAGQTLI